MADRPGRLKSLSEYAMRSIMANIETIHDLGDMPYRIAKPILMQCQSDQLLEIERNSPHLKVDDQEVWEEICARQFDIQRDKAGFVPPKSWRKFHMVETARRKKMEEEAGLRIRTKYQELEAQKQEKRLVFTGGSIPPMKRLRVNGWGKSSAPKSLFEKARSETARHAGIFAAAKPVASDRLNRPLARSSASADNNAVKSSVQISPVQLRSHPLLPASSERSGIVVTSTTLKRPHPDSPLSSTPSSSHSNGVGPSPMDLQYPPPPLRVHHSPPAPSPLFMPKHRTLSQLPSRAR